MPKNTKSPTVIIVGQQEISDKQNNFHAKHLDLLERKLDRQYDAFIRKSDNVKVIDNLQKSFASILEKFMKKHTSMLSDVQSQMLENLSNEFSDKLKELNKDDDTLLKSFMSKLGRLEGSINKLSDIKPQTIIMNKSRTISHDYLSKSFDSFYEKMQRLVEKSRPRLIPSPS